MWPEGETLRARERHTDPRMVMYSADGARRYDPGDLLDILRFYCSRILGRGIGELF